MITTQKSYLGSLFILDEGVLMLVILVQLPFPVIIKKQFVLPLDVPGGIEADLVLSFCEHGSRFQVFPALVCVIDETGQVAHESSVNGSIWDSEVVKGIVRAQAFPQQVDVAIDDLPAVNRQQFSLFDTFSCEETEASTRNGRSSYLCLFELLAHDAMIAAVCFLATKAVPAQLRIALFAVRKTYAFFGPTIFLFAVASPLPNWTGFVAEALRKAVSFLSAVAGLTVDVDGFLAAEVMGARDDFVGLMIDKDLLLPLLFYRLNDVIFLKFLPQQHLML